MPTVSPDDVRRFAELSGDFNPLHLSDVEARRTVFGQPIVHGLYIVLAALDAVMAQQGSRADLQRLKATFHKSVPVQSTFTLTVSDKHPQWTVIATGETAEKSATIRIWLGEATSRDEEVAGGGWREELPEVFDPSDINAAGSVDLRLDRSLVAALFPDAAALLPGARLSVLLAATRIVGMRCPGLHSLFSGLDLTFEPSEGDARLSYAVTSVHAGLGMVEMRLEGYGASGSVEAFLRPKPVAQPGFADLKALVKERDLVGRRALVVGGTRGLGEVVAKLLALRGASVSVTFNTGQDDAERVAAEARTAGMTIATAHLDVTDPQSLSSNASLLQAQTCIVYCATPAIRPNAGAFSRTDFDRYCTFYVEAMILVARVASEGTEVTLAAPSTDFLNTPEPGFAEYTAAKAAAEAVAAGLSVHAKGVTVRMPRLAKVLTDQTNAITASGLSGVEAAAMQLVDAAVSL